MRTIRRAKSVANVVARLADAQHPTTRQPIFGTFRDLLCFAAALGFEESRRVPLGKDTDDFVDRRPLENSDSTIDLMYLLALATTRNVDILRDESEEEVSLIFEEYANGGLEILAEWLKEKPEDINGEKAILKALCERNYLAQNGRSLQAVAGEVSF
ncbi:MAG: DNA phosphorothioation-associated protein 4 [Acidobacteria bacterium]|nr:MAG: DNA phosphorothioation-associated protein 4 [Acidobacteriota bacterium]